MNKLPTYEIFLEDSEQIGLALVNEPAIEVGFLYFNEEVIKMNFNDEQMIVKGPALIPNKLIYRNDNLGERNVFMSENTVKMFAEYLINKQGSKFNLGHTDNIIEANLIESYFTKDDNEFDVPTGSWIISLKIKSQEEWNRIKSGEFKGFSIEGIFSNELSKFEINNKNKHKMDLKEKLMNAVNTVLFGSEVDEVKVPEVETVEVELAELPVPEIEVEVPEETVQLTPEMVQEMIDNSVLVATEQILSAVKEMLVKGTEDTATAMSEMKTKIEEFGSQPLSQPVSSLIVGDEKLSGYQKHKQIIESYK